MEPQTQTAQTQQTQQPSQQSLAERVLSGGNAPAEGPAGESSTGSGESGATAAAAAAPPPTPGLVGMSKEDLQAIIQSTFAAAKPTVAAQPPSPMSPEEFAKTFNVYQLPPELLAKLGGDEVRPLLEAHRDGVVRQALTMAGYQMELLRQKLADEFAPAMRWARQYEMEQLKTQFFSKYGELKDYEPLLVELVASVQSSGKKFDDPDQAMKYVAERAKEILTKMGIKLGTPTANNGNGGAATVAKAAVAASPAKSTNKMSTVSSGGQGGAGGGAQGGDDGKSKSLGMRVLSLGR